jgi:hypothetical protein
MQPKTNANYGSLFSRLLSRCFGIAGHVLEGHSERLRGPSSGCGELINLPQFGVETSYFIYLLSRLDISSYECSD